MGFVQLPNPIVPVCSITDLRHKLIDRIKHYNGYPIIKWIIRNDVIKIDVRLSDGKIKRVFFAYVEDAAYNLQQGFYETNSKTKGGET